MVGPLSSAWSGRFARFPSDRDRRDIGETARVRADPVGSHLGPQPNPYKRNIASSSLGVSR